MGNKIVRVYRERIKIYEINNIRIYIIYYIYIYAIE